MGSDKEKVKALDEAFGDGLTYSYPRPRPQRSNRMAGICTNGHIFKYHGYIDQTGTWRCKKCRYEQEQERKYWKLVEDYRQSGDPDLLEKLGKYWKTP
jgi:hypothetical protein